MRFRTRGVVPVDGTFTKPGPCFAYGGTPLCPVAPVTVQMDSSVRHSSMVDVVTDNFKSISKVGGLVFSPMWKESYHMTQTPSLAAWEFTQSGKKYCNTLHWIPNAAGGIYRALSSDDVTAVDAALAPYEGERDIAITQAWANVDESELLALASLGEAPETIRFVLSLFTRLIRVLGLLRTRKLKLLFKKKSMNPMKFADAMADFWLEARYAVRPFLFEMEQLQAALEASMDKPMRHTARGFHAKTEIISDTTTSIPNGSTANVQERCVSSRSSNYRAGVLYSVGLDDKGYTALFGLDQPLESVYELTKLSFMLDWIFNIGDLIASWTPNAGLTPLGSWLVEEHTFVTSWTQFNPGYSGTWTGTLVGFVPGSKTVTYRVERRIISPDKPVYPHVHLNLDVAKLVDIVAIARSIYRGLMK